MDKKVFESEIQQIVNEHMTISPHKSGVDKKKSFESFIKILFDLFEKSSKENTPKIEFQSLKMIHLVPQDSLNLIDSEYDNILSWSKIFTEFLDKESEQRKKDFLQFARDFLSEIGEQAKQLAPNDPKINDAKEYSFDSIACSWQEFISGQKQRILDIDIASKRASMVAEKAEKTIDGIIPNVITVLGILVSIIIAVVACYITVLITENDKTSFFLPNTLSTPFKIIRYIIMGHIILSVVFLLLYLVGKLTSRSLATSCTMFYPNCDRCIEDCEYKKINPAPECPKYSDQCAICKKECTWRKRLRRKYPYVFAINIIFLIGYAVLLVWHFLSVHFSSKIDELIDSCPWWIPTIGLAVFFALFFLVIFLIFNNKKDAPIPDLPDREVISIMERKGENP